MYEVAPSERDRPDVPELRHFSTATRAQDEFDLINDHSGLLGGGARRTVRRRCCTRCTARSTGIRGALYEQIATVAPHVGLISISMNQRRPKPDLTWVANCPNALDFYAVPGRAAPRRLPPLPRTDEPGQGLSPRDRLAIVTGLPLKIAGEEREPLEQQYFDEFVAPAPLRRIEYLGEVTHGEKVELLQNARATLFPIEWEEPFGLVMIESMACGTPVIATRYGAVPEVIEHGRTGPSSTTTGDGRRARRGRRSSARVVPRYARRSASRPSGWCGTTSRVSLSS